MQVNTINSQTVAAARGRACPLCGAPEGQPCQPKPEGDHLARYLDAYTAGQLTRQYMAMVLGELVVIDACAVIAHPVQAEPDAAQLAEIRLVLDAFDWETDDRQYALEQIDQIVNGGSL